MRESAFAGRFYPSGKNDLAKQVDGFFAASGKPHGNAFAVVSPHAGYIYSGRVAARSFSALRKAKTYVIVSPNHTGIGEHISVFPPGEWETPLGRVKIDGKIAGRIAGKMGAGFDELAHLGEHSIEVQLPFLQRLYGKGFGIVAITLATDDPGTLRKLGGAVYESIKGEDAAVIASSDFTHFESLESAERKDREAIGLIERMEIGGFHNLVRSRRLSICGSSAICSVMECCRLSGIRSGKLLEYGTSARAGGDSASVVGYAAISFGNGKGRQ